MPGGESVLFTIRANPIDESLIAVLSLETGELKVVIRGGTFPRYSQTGHLIYAAAGSLWAVGFDPERLEAVGAPVPVVEGVLTKLQGGANFGLSDNGSLVYFDTRPDLLERALVWVDREGREEELSAAPTAYESPRLSPDGRYVVVEVNDRANRDVMVYDLERDTPTRLTLDPGQDAYPIWAPDGQRVLFASDRHGRFNVYSKAADGTGQAERVATSRTIQWPESWSADGRTLVVGDNPMFQFDLHVLSFGEETESEGLLQSGFNEVNSHISPDGRRIAYQSDESGQFEVYVRPFPDVGAGRSRISRDGGQSPAWSSDGRELFFRRTVSSEMMVVAVGPDTTFGNPEVLFEAPYLLSDAGAGRTRTWDVAQDGRFLMVKDIGVATGSPAQITVVLNWQQELLERVPIQ